jgi:hypothetical protein
VRKNILEDVFVSLIEADILFLVPILFSVFRSLRVLKEGKVSKKSFCFLYILCLVLCMSYKLSNGLGDSTNGVFGIIFESVSQGLLIGSLILNLKDIKAIVKKKWGNKSDK